jgi:hypothetical protein
LSGDGFKPVAGGKEVNCMITTLKVTKIWIEQVKDIEVEELNDLKILDRHQRMLTIWTTEGEKIELYCQAETLDALQFKNPEGWLLPKVYKGSVNDE